MLTAEQAEGLIGAVVRYSPPGRTLVETGVIMSVHAPWVFVRFGAETGAKATPPQDLTVMAEPPRW